MSRRIFTALPACLLVFSTFAQTPPVAPVREVVDEYFGTKIIDPYRWLEDLNTRETQNWLKAQAQYTDNYLKRLPVRDEFLKLVKEFGNTGVSISGVQRRGNLYFYFKLSPGDNDRRVFVREGMNGAEKLLIDPAAFAKDRTRYSITSISPSMDGSLLAFIISAGGAEYGETRVLEVATAKETGDRITNTRWNAAWWLPDNRSFAYLKFQSLPPNAPATEKLQKSRIFRHTIKTSSETDKPVFGYGVHSGIELAPEPIPSFWVPIQSKYVFVSLNSGVSPNSEYWVAPLDALSQNPSPWRKIFALEDNVFNIVVKGDDLYAVTYKNAPRYKVVRYNLKNPS